MQNPIVFYQRFVKIQKDTTSNFLKMPFHFFYSFGKYNFFSTKMCYLYYCTMGLLLLCLIELIFLNFSVLISNVNINTYFPDKQKLFDVLSNYKESEGS